MQFEILGDISEAETFATGSGIRELTRLRKIYGHGRWRKRKGIAHVRLPDGSIHLLRYTRMFQFPARCVRHRLDGPRGRF